MNSSRVIAVDIGNTNTDIGVIDIDHRLCLSHTTIATTAVYRRLGPEIGRLMAKAGLATDAPIIVSSVIKGVRRRLPLSMRLPLRKSLRWVEYQPSLPITVIYRKPEHLGADRLADLVYAHAMYPRKDVIVIDAGTTITVDLLQQGKHFAGGVIMPGIAVQLQSMHRATSQLPRMSIGDMNAVIPGTSTGECLRSGVLFGAAGGLEKTIRELSKLTKKKPVVLATGGSWPLLMNKVDFHHTYIRDLTLIGIGLFSRAYAE